MAKYKCQLCGYIYDEDKEKVKFEDLPDDWKCPMCFAPKSMFVLVEDDNRKIEDDEEQIKSDNSSASIFCKCNNFKTVISKIFKSPKDFFFLTGISKR